MSSTINKIKDTITPGHNTTTHNTTHTTSTHTGTTGTHAEGAHGPHSSRAANAADPRIDSDRDGGHLGQDTHHSTGTGVGHSSHTTGTGVGHSSHTGTGVGATGHSSTTTAGPHSSNLLNKADPRVDSDRSGSSHMGGGTGLGNSSHTQHTTGTSGLGNPGTYNAGHTTTTGHTTTAGPYSSNMANKADPRVDSDRSNVHGTTHSSGLTGSNNHSTTHSSGLTGTHAGNHSGNHHTGTTGGISSSTNAGPHDSNMANKVDPRVDSDLDSKGNRHGAHKGGLMGASGSHATPGSGTAQNTAGPHNSDLLNKLDPRVDSDLSGGKTIGGNKTYQ